MDTRVRYRTVILEMQSLRPGCNHFPFAVPVPSSVEHREYYTVTVKASDSTCPIFRVIRYA